LSSGVWGFSGKHSLPLAQGKSLKPQRSLRSAAKAAKKIQDLALAHFGGLSFSIGGIKILRARGGGYECLINPDLIDGGNPPMKSEYPFSPLTEKQEEPKQAPSRFIDEKLSGESDLEAKANTALPPAGLSNPFWN
jgi:hypothetical protein